MTWDSLLSDDWPTQWSPFRVTVRLHGDLIELIADGHLDAWTASALVRNLVAVYEPSFTDVHLDLRNVTACETIETSLARCREFANSRGAELRVTPPPLLPATHDRPVQHGVRR